MAKKVTEINAGSMADIAFLLLIFFLVTTTMDVDTGITRKLPPPPPKDIDDIKVIERNVLKVLVSKSDRLMIDGKPDDIVNLRNEVREFLRNDDIHSPTSPENKPEKKKEPVNFQILGGDIWPSKGVISLKNDRGTSYDMYIQVQNELAAAIRELRDELSQKYFGMKFSQLTDNNKIKAIQKAIPIAISEAEPAEIGGN